MLHKDGSVRWIIARGKSIKDAQGNVLRILGTITDITDRKQLENQLLQAQKLEAVGRLAGGVAHDFNNLLTAIIGNAELLLEDLPPGNQIETDIGEIKKAADRAASLTRQLLAFSRRQPLQKRIIDLNTVVTNMKKLLQRIIGEDINLITSLDTKLIRIKADSAQIEQVIMNLTVNAYDAMPDGGKLIIKTQNVTINNKQSTFMPESQTGKFVCLSIIDTGIGMDIAILNQIFEPFYSTKGPSKGTGLGLSVVYGIVKQHEGWINVLSEVNQGSTFKIYFPAFLKSIDYPVEELVSNRLCQGNKERILLVEDEEAVRKFTKKALKYNGYIVYVASSAMEAFEVFDREKGDFDLVFSDVVLPDKTGIQLIDHLLSLKPDLPILLCSGYTDQKSQWSLIRQRGFRFLQKPYELSDLLCAIRESIEKSK